MRGKGEAREVDSWGLLEVSLASGSIGKLEVRLQDNPL